MFVAVCPELDNLMALADTEEEAARELKVAIELVLEDMAEDGEDIPAPQIYSSHSGQFRVRIPRTLHARLAQQAQREGVSLNSLVTMFLAEASSQLTAVGYVGQRLKAFYQAQPVATSSESWKMPSGTPGNVLSIFDLKEWDQAKTKQRINDAFWGNRIAVGLAEEPA